ncbi:MAG: PKD domain-containing protein [Thermoplasmatales archaeon]|nr:PKD domain-containing protein [Thermoplasmatales archaeon]
MKKVTAIIMVFLLMGTLFLIFTAGNTLAQPAIVCTDPNTETTTGQTFTKNYFVYYDENVSQGRIYVETYILFKNVNPNTTTFFQVKGSDIFHSGSHLNQTGWYTHLELSEGGTLFMDFGYFSNDSESDHTEEYTLSPDMEYMLKVTVYAPPNLWIGRKYPAEVEIDAWENSTGVSAGAIVFKATITPTLDYYVFGTVYMSDGSPAEFASLNITNKNIGGSVTGLTDKNGEYFVKITEMGYHEGDIIQVSAVKGDEKGSASTVVGIVPPFRQDFLGSQCDVSIMLVYEVSLFPTPETIEVGDTITFNASHYNIKYYFDFGDGTNSGWISNSTVNHIYTNSGQFIVRVKIMIDGNESEWFDNVTITVRPVAFLSASSIVVKIGNGVTFDASNSEGNITGYFFDFGDEANSGWRNDPVVAHVFLTSGTYNVSLKVRDNDIESNNIANVTITVTTDQSSEPEGFIPFLGMEIVILCIFGSAMLLKYKRKRR